MSAGTMSNAEPTLQPSNAWPLGQAWRKGWPWLLFILVSLGVLALFAYLQGGDSSPSKQALDFFALAAPFLAIATALERFWEALFDWYERFAQQVANVAGVGGQGAKWIADEVRNAEATVSDLVTQLGGMKPTDAGYGDLHKAFLEAEQRLLDARERIVETLKTPEYVALKRSITLFGSLVLGVVISVAAKLTLFGAIGFNIPVPVDMVLTGLLIGSGPGPMHDLLKTLTEFRNAVAGLADSAKSGAVRKLVSSIKSTTEGAPVASAGPLVVVQPSANGIAPHTAGGTSAGGVVPAPVDTTPLTPALDTKTTAVESIELIRAAERSLRKH